MLKLRLLFCLKALSTMDTLIWETVDERCSNQGLAAVIRCNWL